MIYLSEKFGMPYKENIARVDGDQLPTLYPNRLSEDIATGFLYINPDGVGTSWPLVDGVNQTETPAVSVLNTEAETMIIDVEIVNYDASLTYVATVTGGSIDTSAHPFLWSLPNITTAVGPGTDEEHYVHMTAHDIAGGKDISSVSSNKCIVQNIV